MGIFSSTPPPPPIKGFKQRLENILRCHFRGILGILVAMLLIVPINIACFGSLDSDWKTVQILWLILGWFWFIHPVNVPVTALLPVVIFPLTGILPTEQACKCYFNDSIALLILGGMVSMMMNHTGVDKIIIMKILCCGKKYDAKSLIKRGGFAAFLMSMITNRSIICLKMYEIIYPTLQNLPSSSKRNEDASIIRDIVNNSIQTAAAIGSTAIIHSAYATLCMKAMMREYKPSNDIFNYLQFSAFMLPLTIVMLILNMLYHIMLLSKLTKRKLTEDEIKSVETQLTGIKKSLPKMNCHQKIAIFCTGLFLIALFLRYNQWINQYWYTTEGTADSTIAAVFCFCLHMLPNSLEFLKVFTAKTRSEMPNKSTSGLLWWQYVDKNTNYAYMLLIGGGISIGHAFIDSEYREIIQSKIEPLLDVGYIAGSLIVILMAGILCNMMTGVAAVAFILPVIMSFEKTTTWKDNTHFAALAVGITCTFGFMWPFRYTPAFFCHEVGKTPRKRLAWYSIGSILICMFVLWIGLAFYAPQIWKTVSWIPVLARNRTGGPTTAKPTAATPAPE